MEQERAWFVKILRKGWRCRPKICMGKINYFLCTHANWELGGQIMDPYCAISKSIISRSMSMLVSHGRGKDHLLCQYHFLKVEAKNYLLQLKGNLTKRASRVWRSRRISLVFSSTRLGEKRLGLRNDYPINIFEPSPRTFAWPTFLLLAHFLSVVLLIF